MSEIDIGNKWGLCLHRDSNTLGFLIPPQKLTPDDALVLAAWLVCLAEPLTSIQFGDVIERVENT